MLVYESQLAGFAAVKPGAVFQILIKPAKQFWLKV